MELNKLALSTSWVFGLVLDDYEVAAQAVNAARHYLGWGTIASLDGPAAYDNPTTPLFTPRSIPYLGPSDFPGMISAGQFGDINDDAPPTAPPPPPPPPFVPGELTAQTDVSRSEWSVIKPLFLLYVERENARALEASRNLGVDVYGRQVGEIQTDIERAENETMPRMAFFQPIETI